MSFFMYYDRQGKPIQGDDNDPTGTLKWADLFEDRAYQLVKQDDTPGGRYRINTIWMGIDHGFPRNSSELNPQPIIFETMVFSKDVNDPYHLEGEQYSTEAQAKAGHEKMLARMTKLEKITT